MISWSIAWSVRFLCRAFSGIIVQAPVYVLLSSTPSGCKHWSAHLWRQWEVHHMLELGDKCYFLPSFFAGWSLDVCTLHIWHFPTFELVLHTSNSSVLVIYFCRSTFNQMAEYIALLSFMVSSIRNVSLENQCRQLANGGLIIWSLDYQAWTGIPKM